MLCNRGHAKFKLSPFHQRAAQSYFFRHDTSVSDIVKIGLSLQNPKNFRTWELFILWNARIILSVLNSRTIFERNLLSPDQSVENHRNFPSLFRASSRDRWSSNQRHPV